MKLPLIQGREAVPVRLIPIATDGWLDYMTLPGILANRLNIGGWNYSSDFEEIEVDVFDEETGCMERTTETRAEQVGQKWHDNGVAAYHLNDGEKPIKMRSTEWEVIYREIKLLEPVLREREKKNGVVQSMEPVWQLKATKILPPGVFLWMEDMDSLWQRHTDYHSRTQFDPPYFRMGVNYDAYLRPEHQKLICEGFEHLLKSSTRTNNLPDRKGMKLPKEKRRKEEDFTKVIQSLFNQLLEERNTEILQPGNPAEFLKRLKK